MANVCIFCGKEPSLFNRRELNCGDTVQSVCGDCYKRYSPLSGKQRCRLALDTGRAQEPEKLQEALLKQETEAQAQRVKKLTDKVCLRCGAPMLKMGQQQFQLGEHSFLWGDWSNLMAGSLTLDLVCCEQCRKVEFFLPEDEPLGEKIDLVTCPKCGGEHEAGLKCPRCAMNQATGQSTLIRPSKPRQKKPPWEA